jgi:hypothetical protein
VVLRALFFKRIPGGYTGTVDARLSLTIPNGHYRVALSGSPLNSPKKLAAAYAGFAHFLFQIAKTLRKR